MSISRINFIPFEGRNHLYHLNNQSDTRETPFKEILDKTTQHKADGYLSDDQPVSKAQLIDIINNIKVQMDAKLVRALSMDTRNEMDVPTSIHISDRFGVSQTTTESPMSNTWHRILNNDTFEGDKQFDTIITQAAKTHGVDKALVKGVIKVESNFNPNVTSPKGAMGLMQLMPETARELGVQNPLDPVENVEAGTRYLKMLLNRFNGNVPLSLSAYNWGMGNMERRPEQMPTETKQYVDKVTSHYEKMKG
jgi:hypothetical protein